MMESNERKGHTPGPWVNGLESDWSIDTDSSNAFCHVGPEGGDPVAIVVTTCSWDDDEFDANTRLIASAPELLEALKDAHRIIMEIDAYMKRPKRGDWGTECALCMGELLDDDREAIEAMRAAITKAEG